MKMRLMVLAVMLLSVPAGLVAAEETSPACILPIPEGSALSEDKGLWPFGVRGGEHPLGHPGFDFEARVGTPILAVTDGSVGHVGPSGHHGGQTISIGHMTRLGWVDTYYTGSISQIRVKKGDRVRQGDVIATLDSAEQLGMPAGLSTFHFGVGKHGPRLEIEEVCPTDYFTVQAQQALERLHRESKYAEQQAFPLLCNPCPPGGCR